MHSFVGLFELGDVEYERGGEERVKEEVGVICASESKPTAVARRGRIASLVENADEAIFAAHGETSKIFTKFCSKRNLLAY